METFQLSEKLLKKIADLNSAKKKHSSKKDCKGHPFCRYGGDH
jgi:hypothetical protein